MKGLRSDGFTLIEVTVVLLALSILAGILLPSIGGFNSLARKVRLKEDLGVLCSMMKVMLDDLGNSAFFHSGIYGRRTYTTSFGSSGGYSNSSGAYAGGAGGDMLVTQSTGPSQEWCVNCDMPRSSCGDCVDDCGEECTHQPASITETVQTRIYSGGSGSASARSWGYSSSYGSVSGSYGARSGYGALGWPVGLMVGAGDIPASAIGATEWQLDMGAFFSQSTSGIYPTAMNFSVGSFDDQLVHGDPSFLGYGNAGRYANGIYGGGRGLIGTDRGVIGGGRGLIGGGFFRWRGPYIADGIAPDPWGNRYMANVFALHAPTMGSYPVTLGHERYVELFSSATVCYSAGPDETIQTYFNQPFGWYTGGDDVTVVLAGAGGIR